MCWGRKEHIPLKVREGDGPKSSSVLCAPLGQTGAFLPERWFLRIPPPPPPSQPGHPWGPASCSHNTEVTQKPPFLPNKKHKPELDTNTIKERHTQRAGPVGRSRSLASRRDTFLCTSGTEALGPLWGVGVKKYRDCSLPAGCAQGWGRPNLNFFTFWFHVGPFPGARARPRGPPQPRAWPQVAARGHRRCARGTEPRGGCGAPPEQP